MDKQRFMTLLDRFSQIRIAIVGDIFLDRLLYVDRSLDELSVETGLTAYQVARRSCVPGAAGVATNNLGSLRIGKCYGVAVTGDDGEAFDLRKGLRATGCDDSYMVAEDGRFTLTYTKVFFEGRDGSVEETNRIDLKPHSLTSPETEARVIANLLELEDKVDAFICMEQIPNGDYGTLTGGVIDTLCAIARRGKARVLADSRFNLNRFHNVIAKCNDNEILRLVGIDAELDGEFDDTRASQVEQAMRAYHEREGAPVFVSCGKAGFRVLEGGIMRSIPAYRVSGAVDTCGAGDSAMAGLGCALCAGASYEEAALFGNLIASIIVEQIGVTGTATRNQLEKRFDAYIRQNANQ